MFSLPNLVSKATEPCVPWLYNSPVPPEVKGKAGKKARDAWINNPSTRHQCYSPFEGFVSNARITKPAGTEEGNPPFKLHAFVVDIDAPLTEQEIETGLGRMGEYLPNYFERTLSGNARFVWLFEKPIAFPNRRFAVEFLELALVKLRFDMIGVGFDKGAFVEPNRYYTNSCEWVEFDANKRIPFALLNGWLVEVSEKHLWRKDRGSVEIPLPVVAAELAKKYPSFPGCWPDDFTEGSQGPTFWVEGSTSPKSAVVKPTGMFTFSGHAVKPFYDWSDLLGSQFVEKYRAEAMGEAVKDIYHDGTKYWRKDGYGDYKWYTKEDIASHLNVDRGLSTVKDGGLPSEVSRAIQHIQNWQPVVGAAPFVFQRPGILVRNGNRFLNTHTRTVIRPSPEPTVWGPSGSFPFLSKYFDGLFDPKEQLDYFLSWLSRFYKGAYNLELESGQNVFLLGKAGVGKTLLNQGILPRLMGGSADAEDYLLGKTQFNSDLFEVALWTVDDNSATVSVETHRKFSAMVKKMAANTTFSYHAKFRVPCNVDWLGRVLVTANDDEESVRIIPDLSISILDKLHLFRAAKQAGVEFPPISVLRQTLDRELPGFARFLLDYQIPEHCKGSSRFGVKAYHEASLLKIAEQSSSSNSFVEVLDDWVKTYFDEHKDLECWEGNAYQLLKELHRDQFASQAALRSLNPRNVAQLLATIKAKGSFTLESSEGDRSRIWKICRPKNNTTLSPLPVSGGFKK